jgi:Ala-tRNA(Pro) deacylase
MPVKKLKEFLDAHRIKYVTVSHSLAYTAQEIAARAHVRGKELAKTVIIKADGRIAMAVLPASYRVDFGLLARAIGADKVDLATEKEFKLLFPDCELGAMPPFGNLYGMDVWVAESLSEDKEIAFSAGTHTELMKLPFTDFQRLVQPRVVKLSAGVS